MRYVRIWPHAAEGKSRTAFLAPDASMVVATHHTVGGRLVLFRGLRIPEEPLGGYIPLSLTGAISQEPLPPSCRIGACSLPDGKCLLAERPPTTRWEVDKPCIPLFPVWDTLAVRGTGWWSFWRLSEEGSVAPISFGIGIRARFRASWSFFGGVISEVVRCNTVQELASAIGLWGGQCVSQPPLLPRTFAVPCLCHGPHVAFSHSRSLLAQHRTTPVVCACGSVRACE